MNWYYAHNGQQQGPVSEAELTQLAQSGTISGTSLVWKEGLPDWQPLSVALPYALSAGAAVPPVTQISGVEVPAVQKDVYIQQMREGVATALPGSVEYAGFWIRVVAKIIDGIVMFIPQMLIQTFFGLAAPGLINTENPGAEPTPEQLGMLFGSMGLVMVLSIGMQALYNGIMVGKYGATLGKMAVGIKVINADRTPVSMGKGFGRYFAELVNSFTCSIGYIIAAFDSEKRALHDHIASTRVVRSR